MDIPTDAAEFDKAVKKFDNLIKSYNKRKRDDLQSHSAAKPNR